MSKGEWRRVAVFASLALVALVMLAVTSETPAVWIWAVFLIVDLAVISVTLARSQR